MYLMGCSLANRYYTANNTRTTIVHHVTGEKLQLFDFLTFFHRNGSSFAVLATYKNKITLDTMFPT